MDTFTKFASCLCLLFTLIGVYGVREVTRAQSIVVPLEVPQLRQVITVYEVPPADPKNTYEYIVAKRRDDRQLMASLMRAVALDPDDLYPTMTNSRTYSEDEHECMTKNIYFEARNQPIKGQVAVALVTLNRLQNQYYPNDICGVVYDRKQFSWYWDGLSDRPRDLEAHDEAEKIASAMLSPELSMMDFTDGATHYHADPNIPAYAAIGFQTPKWAFEMDLVIQIDVHMFYRDPAIALLSEL